MYGKLSEYDVQRIADAVIAKMPINDEALTAEQVAEMMGCTVEALQARIRRGTFTEGHRRGKFVYFSRNEVTRWLLDDDFCINN